MDYFDPSDDERYETVAVPSCANCGWTAANGAYLLEYPREDGTWPLLCDDCAAEERHCEQRAAQAEAAA